MATGDEAWRRGPGLAESLWLHKWLLLAACLLGGVIGYATAAQQPVTYDATARLFLRDPSRPTAVETFRTGIDAESFVPQQAARVLSRPVLLQAVENLDGELTISDVAESIEVVPVSDLLLIDINAVATSAEGAPAIANAVAAAYRSVVLEDKIAAASEAVAELQAQVDETGTELQGLNEQLERNPESVVLQNQIRALSERLLQKEAQIQEVELAVRLDGDGVDLFEAAVAPLGPSGPRKRSSAALGAAGFGVLAAMWAYAQAGRSRKVRHRSEPESILGAPLLGEVPVYAATTTDKIGDRVVLDPFTAEAYEFVLSSVEFALAEVGGRSFLVTSALPGDGKTSTVLQVALAASRDHRSVLLIDADVRARGLTKLLLADGSPGLTEVGTGQIEPLEGIRRYRFSEQSVLPVLTAGARHDDPTSLFRSTGFRQAMQTYRRDSHLVIADSPPLLPVADAMIVAGTLDAVVLVVNHGTPVADLQKVRERLTFVSTPLLGYIYNRSEQGAARRYGYGYGYGSQRPSSSRRRGRRDRAATAAARSAPVTAALDAPQDVVVAAGTDDHREQR